MFKLKINKKRVIKNKIEKKNKNKLENKIEKIK